MNSSEMTNKREEILNWLDNNYFNTAFEDINKIEDKQTRISMFRRINYTRVLMHHQCKTPKSIYNCFWNIIKSKKASQAYYEIAEQNNVLSFEDILVPFRNRFSEEWLKCI